MNTVQKANQPFMIDGPEGKLEAIMDYPRNKTVQPVIHIICHPHPLYQGTMYNKVVTTLSRAYKSFNIPSLRFNFRGVMNSEGEYGYSKGETEDLIAVSEWVRANYPDYAIVLSGFSFGGSVAYKGQSRIQGIKQLITIAPAIVNFPVYHEPEPECPWLIIQGDDDEIVSPQAVFQFLTQDVESSFVLAKMHQTGHFFHGKLIDLKQELTNYLYPRINTMLK
jgi:alpha/beta superfamily hydrolase